MAGKILIITGKLVEREELSDILKDNYEILCATNGEEGRKYLLENGASLECVFIRADLPGISGETLVKAASESGLTRKITYIVIEGEDDPDTIETMSDIADVLNGKEQYDKAELLYKKVLEKRIAVLGEDDPDTIETMNDLATVLDLQEKYDESLLLYRKVMAKNIELFGEDDPDTIESIYNVASTLVPLEKYNEAKKFAEKAYTLGKAHLNYDEYGELLEDIEELLDEL